MSVLVLELLKNLLYKVLNKKHLTVRAQLILLKRAKYEVLLASEASVLLLGD